MDLEALTGTYRLPCFVYLNKLIKFIDSHSLLLKTNACNKNMGKKGGFLIAKGACYLPGPHGIIGLTK